MKHETFKTATTSWRNIRETQIKKITWIIVINNVPGNDLIAAGPATLHGRGDGRRLGITNAPEQWTIIAARRAREKSAGCEEYSAPKGIQYKSRRPFFPPDSIFSFLPSREPAHARLRYAQSLPPRQLWPSLLSRSSAFLCAAQNTRGA